MNAILPLPSFYDPANAGKWDFEPNAASLLELALDWASTYKIKPATGDRLVFVHTHIDEQNDFSIPPLVDQHGRQIGGGSLFVGGRSGRGAVDDSARIAEFMYRNMGLITAHQFTIDTHNPYQLFCRAFWRTADGKVPAGVDSSTGAPGDGARQGLDVASRVIATVMRTAIVTIQTVCLPCRGSAMSGGAMAQLGTTTVRRDARATR